MSCAWAPESPPLPYSPFLPPTFILLLFFQFLFLLLLLFLLFFSFSFFVLLPFFPLSSFCLYWIWIRYSAIALFSTINIDVSEEKGIPPRALSSGLGHDAFAVFTKNQKAIPTKHVTWRGKSFELSRSVYITAGGNYRCRSNALSVFTRRSCCRRHFYFGRKKVSPSPVCV